MHQKAGEKKNWIMRTAGVLLVLVLFSTRLICGLYARFSVTGSSGNSARAAAFVFVTQDAENQCYLDLSGIQKPGDEKTYTFTVSNMEGSTVSEVAETYRFAVQINGSMPLVCTISKAETAVLTANRATAASLDAPTVASWEGAEAFAASTGRTDTYTMTVTWPQEENDIKFASHSAVAEVLLTVTAEQVD